MSLDIVDSGINLSDHIPVFIEMKLQFEDGTDHVLAHSHSGARTSLGARSYNLRWDRMVSNVYYEQTRLLFEPVKMLSNYYFESKANSRLSIETVYDNIVNSLKSAGHVVPRAPVNFYKFWWDATLDDLKSKSIETFQLWTAVGKPRQGDIFIKMKKAKAEYKLCIKEKERDSRNFFSDELNDALMHKDTDAFWKSWNSKFKRRGGKGYSQIVEGANTEADIAEVFANFFKTACTSNNSNTHLELKVKFEENYKGYMKSNRNCTTFTVEEVVIALSKLKRGKASGFDNVTCEHILYAHPIVVSCITDLFNMIMQAGCVPKGFGRGIMIPLLKNGCLDPTKCENYRGITLSPVISKIFEHCLLEKFGLYLITSDLQFGFKSGVGCADALYTLRGAIKYLNQNNSTAVISALDISKAFDKVCHHGLFLKLVQRGTPRCFIDILLDWYSKCFVNVRWGNALSESFNLMAGVRQGGVLSPVLFSVYINDLINALQNSGYGCHINGLFLGCLMYADDILLISHSITGMQNMLNICTAESYDLDLKFNTKKSMVMRVGKRYACWCAPLVLDGTTLSYVQEIRYLGVVLKSGRYFRTSISEIKLKFYKNFNSIYNRSKSAHSELICVNLVKSYCLPMILYGTEATYPNKSTLNALDRLIQQAVCRIFNVHCRDTMLCIRDMVGLQLIHDAVKYRQQSFLMKFKNKSLFFSDCIVNVCLRSEVMDMVYVY